MENGNFVDEYTMYTYTETDPPIRSDGLVIEKGLSDVYINGSDFSFELQPQSYSLCEDGLYRTPEVCEEYYYNDGRSAYYHRRYVSVNNQPCVIGKDVSWMVPDDREGEYCTFDKDGNVTDYGIYTVNGWESTKPEEDNDDLRDEFIFAGVLAVGILTFVGLTFSIDEDSDSFKKTYLQSRRNEIAAWKSKNSKYDELIEEAEEAADWGLWEKASDLFEEAQNYNTDYLP